MTQKYTKGPWLDIRTENYAGSSWIEIDIPQTNEHSINKGPIIVKATKLDIQKMIAAPDLLEALKWFIDDIDGTHTVMVEFDANVERARVAIAKAEGKI